MVLVALAAPVAARGKPSPASMTTTTTTTTTTTNRTTTTTPPPPGHVHHSKCGSSCHAQLDRLQRKLASERATNARLRRQIARLRNALAKTARHRP
jgi:hypothetical protein